MAKGVCDSIHLVSPALAVGRSGLLEAAANVAQLRQQELRRTGMESYVNAVDMGKMREVCAICRVHRRLRSPALLRCQSDPRKFAPWVSTCTHSEYL